MDRVEAYSKLFNAEDKLASTYIRLLSKSEEGVPEEIIDYLEGLESRAISDSIEEELEEVEFQIEEEEENSEEESVKELPIEETESLPVEPDLVIAPEETFEASSGIEIEIEPKIELTEVAVEIQVDPLDILRDFYGHLKKSQVYRKIRNSDNPEDLCKSVSSFCTRYLIELHSSDFDSDDIREAVNERISVGEILRLLANYVDEGDLSSLAKAVVIIRNFLENLDNEFKDVEEKASEDE